jgi:hypothetical protein
MADREQIKAIIKYMRGAYPNYHPELAGDGWNAVDVLLDQLGDMDAADLLVAVRAACAESGRTFAPSAGEIRGAFADLKARALGIPTAAEAWAAIMESFRRVRSAQPEMLKLPIVAEAIRCMGGLDTIGMSENNMADRAHFLKIYDQLRERQLSEFVELPAVTQYVQAQKQIASGIRMLVDRLDANA